MSVVVIFLDEERFLGEAIESVLTQTWSSWELLLVDDGSTDRSPEIARGYAGTDGRITCLHHEGRANKGMSASRNLGLLHARGEYVAFLDGDDVWLPHKLRQQVADLEAHPEAAMTYGPLLRWRRWTGDADAADHEDLCGVGRRRRGLHPYARQVVPPPRLVPLIIRDDYFTPSGGLIRTAALREIGGYEERFRGMHEDGVAMLKLCATHPVYVSDDVAYLYRMHPDSCTHRHGEREAKERARWTYLEWIEHHLASSGVSDGAIDRSLRSAWRPLRHPSLHAALDRRTYGSLALRAGSAVARAVLPRSTRDALRRWYRTRTAPSVAGSVPAGDAR